MKTQKKYTRFMEGNKDVDGEIIDLLYNYYGKTFFECDIDFDNAIYSNGFIHAIENNLIPEIDSMIPSFESKINKEYHHLIINNECYILYFKKATE